MPLSELALTGFMDYPLTFFNAIHGSLFVSRDPSAPLGLYSGLKTSSVLLILLSPTDLIKKEKQ